MSVSKQTAKKIIDQANDYGWDVTVRGSILTITKTGIVDKDAFVTADMEYSGILGLLPLTQPGSMWGTDGGGMGAMSAMNTGTFTMNQSGGSKRVLNALSKMKA